MRILSSVSYLLQQNLLKKKRQIIRQHEAEIFKLKFCGFKFYLIRNLLHDDIGNIRTKYYFEITYKYYKTEVLLLEILRELKILQLYQSLWTKWNSYHRALHRCDMNKTQCLIYFMRTILNYKLLLRRLASVCLSPIVKKKSNKGYSL